MKKLVLFTILVFTAVMFLIGFIIGIPTIKIKDDVRSTTIQKIWGDNVDSNSIPPLLSQADFFNIYSQTVQSIKDRNFDNFKDLISYQRLWRLNYKMIDYLPFENGIPVIKVEKVDQRQQFYDFSIANILNYAPNPESIILERLENNNNNITDNNPMRYYNSEEGIDILIDQTGYKYTATLICHATGLQYFSEDGTGKITFVYEDGRWKFDWQIWYEKDIKVELINNNTESGDINYKFKEISVDLNTMLNDSVFSFEKISINKGEIVKWTNATGVIQSTMHSDTDLNWFSPFLNSGSFYKRFDDTGIFNYQIIYADNIFSGVVEVL